MKTSCHNCDRVMGNLEHRVKYRGHVVCAGCATVLKNQRTPSASAQRGGSRSSGNNHPIVGALIPLLLVGVIGAVAVVIYKSAIQPIAQLTPKDERPDTTDAPQPSRHAAEAPAPAADGDLHALVADGDRLQATGKFVEARDVYRRAIDAIAADDQSALSSELPRLKSAIQQLDEVIRDSAPKAQPSLFADDNQKQTDVAANNPAPVVEMVPPAADPAPQVVVAVAGQPDAPANGGDATPRPAAPVRAAMVDPHREGWALVAESRQADAKVIFERLVAANAKDAQALHGLGVCLYYINGPKAATYVPIEKALPALKNDPVFINNAAAIYMETLPMRSVKLLKDYMSDTSHPLLESMQNAMGTCLARADASAQQQAIYIDATRLYFDNDKKLEISHGTGERRWGMNWVDPKEATTKWAAIKSATTEFTAASSTADHANLATQHAHASYQDLVGDMRLKSRAEVVDHRLRWEAAVRFEQTATENLQIVRTKFYDTEKPPFPATVDVLSPVTDEK